MFISLIRVFKFAYKNFWRNIWLSLATVSIIVLTLISVSFLAFVNVLASQAVTAVKERVDISVYFKPEVTPQEVRTIQSKLQTFPEIQDVRYISREDSVRLLQDTYKNDVMIIESLKELGSNPLGDTIVIKAKDLADYPVILDALEKSQYRGLIEDKNYEDSQVYISKIYNVTDKVKRAGWFMSAVFAGIAILIVFNTIRIAIYTHGEEINIMKLVGASNWFIRGPFLVEAVLYAISGTILTAILLFPILHVADPYIMSFFDGSFSIFSYYAGSVFAFSAYHFIGITLLTMLASFLAVGRYVDV
ncbi:MAG: ABC transporter permease [Candidatus Jacksonbacteria bacterium]|nr:ABC transporter permease [Candidatus Jacksonbacteria bacterium]